jgi:hypothetical protein
VCMASRSEVEDGRHIRSVGLMSDFQCTIICGTDLHRFFYSSFPSRPSPLLGGKVRMEVDKYVSQIILVFVHVVEDCASSRIGG